MEPSLPSVPSLEHTILQFYTTPTHAAHETLQSFHSQPNAWVLAFELLRSTHTPVRLFAATVLRNRARTDASCFSDEQLVEFIEKAIRELSHGGQDVRPALSVALAFVANDPSTLGNLVTHPNFSSLDVDGRLSILAAVAEVTQECDREELLLPHVPVVESLVREGFGSGNTVRALQCLESWSVCGLNLVRLSSGGLLPFLVSALQADVCAASPAFVELCQAQVDDANARSQGPQLFAQLQPAIASIHKVYGLGRAAGDEDVCLAACRALVAFGKGFVDVVAATLGGDGGALIEAILECTETGTVAVSEMSLEFWDDFVYVAGPTTDVQYSETKNAIYTKLTRILAVRCEYPADFSGWDSVALMEEDFTRLRTFSRSVFTYCSWTLAANVCQVLCAHLAGSSAWQGAEATMFALSCVGPDLAPQSLRRRSYQRRSSRNADLFAEADTWLTELFNCVLLHSTPQCPPLLQTTLDAAASCAGWIGRHPETMHTVLVLGLQALGVSGCAESAGKAIYEMCTKCTQSFHDAGLVDGFIDATLPHLTARGSEHVLRGLVHLAMQGDSTTLDTRLQTVFQPPILLLQQLAACPPTEENSLRAQQVLLTLSSGVSALETLTPPSGMHPAATVLAACWDHTVTLLPLYSAEQFNPVVECVFHLYLDSFKAAPASLMPNAGAMVGVILDTFKHTAAASCMDSLKELSQLLKNGGASTEDMQQVLRGASDILFALLSNGQSNPVVAPPALVAYFDLLFFLVLLQPKAITQWDGLPSILEFSLRAFTMRSSEVTRSVYVFIENLLWRAKEELCVVHDWVRERGSVLIESMVVDVAERVREDGVQAVGEAMHALLQLAGEGGFLWVRQALEAPNFPQRISLAGRRAFLEQVKAAAPKSDPKGLVVACANFHESCRIPA